MFANTFSVFLKLADTIWTHYTNNPSHTPVSVRFHSHLLCCKQFIWYVFGPIKLYNNKKNYIKWVNLQFKVFRLPLTNGICWESSFRLICLKVDRLRISWFKVKLARLFSKLNRSSTSESKLALLEFISLATFVIIFL